MKIRPQILTLLFATVSTAAFVAACGSSGNSGSAGNVTPQCVEPGTSECTDSSSGIVCAEGETTGVAFSCESGEVCEEGACVGQCEPSSTQCLGSLAVRVCTEDGREWVPVACQPGDACVDGACTPLDGAACHPGTSECLGSGSQRVCDASGTWVETECPDAAPCSEGACRGEVCAVGEVRCDESVHDLGAGLLQMYGGGFGIGAPNFQVVYRCVDGSAWEQETCSGTEVCTYSGVPEAEANRYRDELSSWSTLLFGAEVGSAPPKPPALGPLVTASCQENECAAAALDPDDIPVGAVDMYSLFEGALPAALMRQCGEFGAEAPELEDLYARFSQCNGVAPYSQLRVETRECGDGTMCTPDLPARGCAVPECFPGEKICSDTNSSQACDPSSLDWAASEDCFACEETGESPERDVTCTVI